MRSSSAHLFFVTAWLSVEECAIGNRVKRIAFGLAFRIPLATDNASSIRRGPDIPITRSTQCMGGQTLHTFQPWLCSAIEKGPAAIS